MTSPAAYTPSTPTWYDGPSGGTDIDAVDLNGFTAALLNTNFDIVGLRWSTSANDYQPAGFKADTSKMRLFAGPVDPTTVSGVAITARDLWINA